MIERGRNDGAEIDVAQEVEGQPVAGERGPADVGRRTGSSPGTKAFLMSSIGAVVILGTFLTYKGFEHAGEARVAAEQKEKDSLVTNRLPPIRPDRAGGYVAPSPAPEAPAPVDPNQVPALTAAPIVPTTGTATVAQAGGTNGGVRPPTRAEVLRMRRLSGGFGSGLGDGGAAGAGGAGGAGGDGGPAVALAGPAANGAGAGGAGEDTLQARLQPVKLTGSRAGVLGDRNLLITKGSMIDCGLGTRLDSTVPGMVSCFVTRDVWSANGAVVLIPRNSKVTGSYGRGIAQGQARIFVTWDRVEAPNGVVIDLDSPGTDQLGGGGIPGKVDSHFMARFGGAILMSVISDALQTGIAAASKSGTTSINTSSQTSDELANTALQNSINIAPTLYKNQGDRVNIFVARDLDFSGIYALKRR
jgi:type IV secretion system protein VirB10